ncbi:MAG TPA: hypothetical protein VK968_15400, partial [Roseimicrobium sp.]|nr:hypothetical protein [Roseimicrobium sp.]
VMLTDVRDVLFQKAPFDFDLKDRVLAFNESRAISLDNCRDYRTWIASAYGDSALKEFEGKRISCCGITLGSFEGMSEYLDLMADGMITNSTREPYLFGLDSAVHNHLILRGKIPGLRVMENLEGPVLTMGGMSRNECLLDDAGRLVNRDRSVIPIIHQYDRHPEIAKVIERSLQPAGA